MIGVECGRLPIHTEAHIHHRAQSQFTVVTGYRQCLVECAIGAYIPALIEANLVGATHHRAQPDLTTCALLTTYEYHRSESFRRHERKLRDNARLLVEFGGCSFEISLNDVECVFDKTCSV